MKWAVWPNNPNTPAVAVPLDASTLVDITGTSGLGGRSAAGASASRPATSWTAQALWAA